MQRSLYIDYAKGFATICIIFIHTVFWSGQFYVPVELRLLSLLFDVPLFFALSGLTAGADIEKTIYRLLKLQFTYMIFVTGLFLADWAFKVFGLSFFSEQWLREVYLTFGSKFSPSTISTYPDWAKLGNWYIHNYSNADIFPVVMGSFWYLRVYFTITFIGVIIIRFFREQLNFVIFLLVGTILIMNFLPNMYPPQQTGYHLVYLTVFLLANRIKNLPNALSKKALLFMWAGIVLAFVFLSFYYGKEVVYAMNKQKFPPKLPYIIWASFSLGILFTLFRRLQISKEGFLVKVGQNAIFYYFAQGVSSSLIYFLVVIIKEYIPFYISLPIVFVINILLAVQLAKLFNKTDELGWKLLQKIRAWVSTM